MPELLIFMFLISMTFMELPVLGNKEDCGEGSCESDDTVLLQLMVDSGQPFSPLMNAVRGYERNAVNSINRIERSIGLRAPQPSIMQVSLEVPPAHYSEDRSESKAMTEKNIAVQLDEDVHEKANVAGRALEHDTADALTSTHVKELHAGEEIKRNAMNKIEACNMELEMELETSRQQLKSELTDIDRDEFEAVEDAKDEAKRNALRVLAEFKKQRKALEESDTAAHEIIKNKATKSQARIEEQAASDIAHITLEENKADLENTRDGLNTETGILKHQIEHNFKEDAATASLAKEQEIEATAKKVANTAYELDLDQLVASPATATSQESNQKKKVQPENQGGDDIDDMDEDGIKEDKEVAVAQELASGAP